MKKNLFMVAAVALMALVSCNKEELQNNTNGVVFTAEFEQDASTKTTLGDKGEKGRKALWVEGDKISINGTEFSAVSGGEVAEFKTEADFAEAATYRAVYPAESHKGTGVIIPLSQNGTFENASIAVAESSTQTLVFNNVSSILKFQVPVACKTVTFESINSIAGQVSVSYNNGEMVPDYTSLTNPQKKITVTADFVTGKDYYVAVKPGSQKFTVSIDGKLSKASNKSVTVERTHIHNLGVLPKPIDPVYVYVKNDMGWSTVNIYGFEKANDKNLFTAAWPGTKMTTTETINGTSFLKFELPASFIGKEVGIVFNNGTKQLSDYVATINATTHLRLTPGTPIVVDPQNKSSFKYRIYVYDQPKKKNVNIYYWGTGITGTGWPGTKITNYVDYDYKSLGYYEIPAEAYNGKTFNYLLNVNGDELKTGDLSVVNPTSDLVIGYWHNGSQQGFWMNGTKPYTNADSCN